MSGNSTREYSFGSSKTTSEEIDEFPEKLGKGFEEEFRGAETEEIFEEERETLN